MIFLDDYDENLFSNKRICFFVLSRFDFFFKNCNGYD